MEYSYAFNSMAPNAWERPLGPPRIDSAQLNQRNRVLGNNLNQPPAIIPQKKFTADERILVKKVLANVVNFMQEDKLSAKQVFGQYDFQKNNTISARDCERALYDELYIEQDANCDLFVEYYKDASDRVNLKMLYTDIDRFTKAKINPKQFDLSKVQRRIAENPMSVLSKEKLVGYSHPTSNADKAHTDKMKTRIDKIKDFFFLQYG